MKGNSLLTSTWMRSSRLGCDMARQGVEILGRKRGREEEVGKRRGKFFFFFEERK